MNTTVKKSVESRKNSDKNNQKNTKKKNHNSIPSSAGPLKLKISKNKEPEISSRPPSSDLKLVVSNGRIVRWDKKNRDSEIS